MARRSKKREIRLRARSLSIPLSFRAVRDSTDFYIEKDDHGIVRQLTKDEEEWCIFLLEEIKKYHKEVMENYKNLIKVNAYKDEATKYKHLSCMCYTLYQLSCITNIMARLGFVVANQEIAQHSKKTLELKNQMIALEAALADSKAENDKLRERVAELENAPQAGDWDDIPYTLWREVLAMREKGMTDSQIAEKLHDKGQGASKAQLGALLYSGNAKIPAQKTLQDYGTELFR